MQCARNVLVLLCGSSWMGLWLKWTIDNKLMQYNLTQSNVVSVFALCARRRIRHCISWNNIVTRNEPHRVTYVQHSEMWHSNGFHSIDWTDTFDPQSFITHISLLHFYSSSRSLCAGTTTWLLFDRLASYQRGKWHSYVDVSQLADWQQSRMWLRRTYLLGHFLVAIDQKCLEYITNWFESLIYLMLSAFRCFALNLDKSRLLIQYILTGVSATVIVMDVRNAIEFDDKINCVEIHSEVTARNRKGAGDSQSWFARCA